METGAEGEGLVPGPPPDSAGSPSGRPGEAIVHRAPVPMAFCRPAPTRGNAYLVKNLSPLDERCRNVQRTHRRPRPAHGGPPAGLYSGPLSGWLGLDSASTRP